MSGKLLGLLFLGLISSCGSETASDQSKSNIEMEDTVSNYEISSEDLIEDGPNEFEWLEDVLTYEGKEPDSDISLALMISGVRDTLDLFTIWSFPEDVSDKTKNMVGFPENVVASKGNYDSDEFIAIQEVSTEKYNILLAQPYMDTISIEKPIGTIELKNGLINFSINFDENNYTYHKFGETSPWPNYDN